MDDLTPTITLTCPSCGASHERLALLRHAVTCGLCVAQAATRAAEHWRSHALATLTERVNAMLRTAGMGDVELSADLGKVPVPIKRALPRADVQRLLDGDDMTDDARTHSFGLTGGQGVGKTMCLAALVRAWTVVRLTRMIAAQTAEPADDDEDTMRFRSAARVRWLHLPTFAETVKATSVQDRGTAAVDALCRSLSHVGVLVLDDLGRERMARGGYDEDIATATLDRIIDARSRSRLPIWWTANIGPTQLAARYGAALTSRLLGLAPAIELPAMQDIRLTVPRVGSLTTPQGSEGMTT